MKKLITISLLLLSFFKTQANLPTEEKYKLKNKMQVVFLDYGTLPVTYVCLFVNTGKKNETPGMQSIADLTANSLLLGSTKYDRVKLDSFSFLLGSSISASSNDNFTRVSMQFLNRDQDKAMNLFSDVVLNPLFPKDEIDDYIKREEDENTPAKMDIDDLAGVYSRFVVYGAANPIGRNFYTTQLNKISAAQVNEFYKFNYTPKNCTLVICGHPDKEKMKSLIDGYFGGWGASYGEVNGVSLPDVEIDKKEYTVINRDNATQASLVWAKKAPDINSKDLGAFEIANDVFSTMLFKQIREKEGKTYGIYSIYQPEDNNGTYTIRTQVRNEVMYNTTQSFDKVLQQFYDSGAPKEYFETVKNEIKANVDGIQSPREVVSLFNPLLYPDYEKRKQTLSEMDNVDIDKVNKIIKKYFKPSNYKLLIAGNEAELQPQLDQIPGLVKLQLNAIEVDQ